jgi:hypothetical protein
MAYITYIGFTIRVLYYQGNNTPPNKLGKRT